MGDNFLSSIYKYLGTKLGIALFILFILIFLLILITLLQKVFKKTPKKEQTKNKQRISLDTSSAKSPKHELILLDKKVRNFFKTKLKSESELTYSEIIKKLKEKNKPTPISFCKEMSYHLYSEKTTSKQEVEDMKNKFRNILENKNKQVKKTKPFSKPEKKKELKIINKKKKITKHKEN